MNSYKGLNDVQVKLSREKNGLNEIIFENKNTFWGKYFGNFKDPLIKILLAALCINLMFVFFGKVSWYETVGIFISIMISTFVSTISEYKNENAFEKIRDEASKTMCKVYRNEKLNEILVGNVVVGDYVLLETGDAVPADGLIISGEIKVDQSSLNGESEEIRKYKGHNCIKDIDFVEDFWDQNNLFRGSLVCSGSAVMKVLRVGVNTVYGKMNREIHTLDRDSPLVVKLSKLADGISKFGYIGAILVVLFHMIDVIFLKNCFDKVLIFNYLKDFPQITSDFIEALILGIVVIVVAVPEGLPLMIAIVCSINMKKMLKSNVLVRKIIGIETAGSINILFSDKTGTMTYGRPEVTKFILGNNKIYSKYKDMSEKIKDLVFLSLEIASSSLRGDQNVIGGNVTEKALLKFVTEQRQLNLKKIDEMSFNSEQKFSAFEVRGDYNLTIIKGMPEKIIKNLKFYYDENGVKKSLHSVYELGKEIENMARSGHRVIAIAVSEAKIQNKIPSNLILIGIVGMRDEIRPEVRNSINEVKRAGISVVMVTGDKKETAVTIAREIGLLEKNGLVKTSEEINLMSDEELKNKIMYINVIARAMPSDKSRLVRISQEMGLVVGMTGDGVNDSPALKMSDVGFAMGSGSEISKEASDIVILNDDFSSIKKAVLYGRTIYNNIKKFITFQLTINVAAVFISIIGPLLGVGKALDITQMLWVNLVMDTLAAIAFGGEAALKKYLFEKPKKRNENIIDKSMWSAITMNGLFICSLSMFMFLSSKVQGLFRQSDTNIHFYTGYFTFFIFTCIFNAFNTRTSSIDLSENISINKNFVWTMFFITLIQIFMTHFGGSVLRTSGLTLTEWFVVLAMASLIIPVDVIRKIFIKFQTR
ncbi:MAG: calcium-translocating P-type ATPase, PMCA-type [Clostridiales bacterium]|jgi:calcium-translocating P-type ATPase|nr:calcium-translocating P-type ATPase, PMCA-type [Clostridiales bacterium]